MQEFSHRGKIAVVSIWFRMELTQIISWVYKDSPTLRYPPSIFDWYCNFDTPGRFFDTIIHVDHRYPCIPLHPRPALVSTSAGLVSLSFLYYLGLLL